MITNRGVEALVSDAEGR